MYERKSQTPQMIKSMVHGKPSRRNPSQPGIYDIFYWEQPKQIVQNNPIAKNSRNQSKNRASTQLRNQNQGQNNQQCCHQAQQLQPFNQRQGHQRNIVQNAQQNPVYNQYMVGKAKKQLKPHGIKNQLYMYQNIHIKRHLSEDEAKNKSQIRGKPAASIQKLKLNENNPQEKTIIDKRKEKIKNFKQFTRDLPNSAFTTYYGRPAFESYGRCNSGSTLKTHNVMPHRGENHPKVKQTYQSALIKGKHLKIQDHLPRKPIEGCQSNIPNSKTKANPTIHLPLQKPDLVNHIRFSEAKTQSDRKQAVPSIQQLKKQIKNHQAKKADKKTFKSKRHQQKIKSDTDLAMTDGLKFMNTRDHLIDLIQSKKTRDSRVAYKVTECYPEKGQQLIRKTLTDSDAQEDFKAAGIAYVRGQQAQDVIYRRY